MRQLLLVAGLLAVTGAVTVPSQIVGDAPNNENVAEKDSVLAQTILNHLEEFRVTMTTGSDKIPVLDPLVIEQIDLKGENFGIAGLTVAASNVSVNKLSTFVVDSLDVSSLLLTHNITFNVTIPSLEIQADSYSFQAEILGIRVFGDGSAKLKFLSPRLVGSVVVKIDESEKKIITVTGADLILGLAGFESEITGLFGNENASTLANHLLKHLVPEAMTMFQTEISGFLNSNVPVIINKILADIL